MLCYIAQKYPHTESAAFKSRTDMNSIMAAEGFRNVGAKNNLRSTKAGTWLATLGGVIRSGFSLHKGDVLVVQYPMRPYFKAVCRMAHIRGAKVVALIHDLESFKRQDITPSEEVRLLSACDYIIALNPSMEQWLRDHGSCVPSVPLGIWDYLSHDAREARQTAGKVPPRRFADEPLASDGYDVMFVGGVCRRRNQFLYDWGTVIDGYKVIVYGNNFDTTQAAKADSFKLRGFVPSGLMIRHPEGHFGLVWDGDTLDGCHGKWGEYLRYNNPHKASLYLRCGLPVIIWKHAGLAPFVEKEGIGFTVESLAEIAPRLKSMTPAEYARMKENVARVSSRIASGAYFRSAVARATEALGAPQQQLEGQLAIDNIG